jgi:hypothetical protein
VFLVYIRQHLLQRGGFTWSGSTFNRGGRSEPYIIRREYKVNTKRDLSARRTPFFLVDELKMIPQMVEEQACDDIQF